MKNCLIITPLVKERDLLLKGCTERGLRLESGKLGRLPVIKLPELGFAVAQGGAGKVQFAVQTQHLLDNSPSWDLVICAGAAGGLTADVTIGDVVIGTSTVEHDYQNKFSSQPLPAYDAPESVLQTFKDLTRPQDFTLHFGPIASGDEDIVTAGRSSVLNKTTGALAAAWEGAGGAKACQFSKTPFLELRAVTDTADHNAATDFASNLGLAMGNLCHLLVGWSRQGG